MKIIKGKINYFAHSIARSINCLCPEKSFVELTRVVVG